MAPTTSLRFGAVQGGIGVGKEGFGHLWDAVLGHANTAAQVNR
jgi:hypothetical protein